MEELGPTFIKFGQILSSRPDLIPPDFYEEFSRLQDKVAPFPYEQVQEIIKKEFGKELNELFLNFSETSFASASIAQVHKAELKSGQEVIVKVRRPNIRENISRDCFILQHLARLAERYIPEAKIYNPVGLVEEFSYVIRQELDFTIEAAHANRFRKNFEEDSSVFIPKVFPELTTQSVLTMEKIEGIKINDFEALDKAGFDRCKLALQGVTFYLRQIFDHGFFHADPHPGNIFVLEDGRLAFVDFGIVGRVSKPMLMSCARIFKALVKRDSSAIIHGYLSMGISTADVNMPAFQREVEDFLDRYYNVPLKRIKLEEFFNEMGRLSQKHQLTLPQDFVLLGKTMFVVGGLGRGLCPDFNMLEAAEPFARKLIAKRFEPKEIAQTLRTTGEEVFELLANLPRQWREISAKLNRGEINIKIKHKGLDNLIVTLERLSSRIAFSLIIAGIVIGSSLIIKVDMGPKLFDYPIIGVVGYVLAGILGLWLAVTMLRSGKL